jgi:hypothetical protein
MKANKMSQYKSVISQSGNGIYAMIVRVDRDGEESVIHGYAGRFFKTVKAAEKSTSAYIAKFKLND